MSRHGYIDLYFAGGEHWTFYICDFEKYQKIKREDKIKELIKLVEQLEKLMIRIISLVGWALILIKLIT